MKLIDHLRKAVLKGHGARLRKILLTDDQRKLVKAIAELGSVRTCNIMRLQGVSVQCASAKLRTLEQKGYLERVERSSDTGGIEFVYCVKEGLL